MGNYRNIPNENLSVESGSLGQGKLQYVVASQEGWRKTMEDAHIVCGFEIPSKFLSLTWTALTHLRRIRHPFARKDTKKIANCFNHLYKEWIILGLFDGHGGAEVATQASWILPGVIIRHMQNLKKLSTRKISQTLIKAYSQADNEIREIVENPKYVGTPGTTAITALISPVYNIERGIQIFLSGVGDSLALLASAQGEIKAITRIHSPQNPEEILRIKQIQGKIIGGRVEGILSMTRAIGDYHLKNSANITSTEPLISVMPDISIGYALPGDILIITCDSIWKCMPGNKMVQWIQTRMHNGETLLATTRSLIKHCMAKEAGFGPGHDNMTIIIGIFRH